MPLISIICPVYNIENYITRCINSILIQSFSDFELLLIDDGSTDCSGSICDFWAKKDNRIRTFHKTNGGVSSARNFGIEIAAGRYIMFIDADDWIDNTTLAFCSNFIDKYDVIRFSINYYYGTDSPRNSSYTYDNSTELDKCLRDVIGRSTILGVCGSIFKRDIFLLNNIRFDETLSYGEDWLVLYKVLRRINSIVTASNALYYYDKTRDTSCTNNLSYKKIRESIFVMKNILEDKNLDKTFEMEKAACKCDIFCALINSEKSKPIQLLKHCKELNRSGYYPSYKEIATVKMKAKKKIALLLILFYNSI